MRIKPEVIDELLKDYKKPEDVLGQNGLLKQLTKALLERAMNAELTHHLGYEKHERAREKEENARNGSSEKTLETDQGEMVVQVPRDRNATFEPQIVRKHQRRFAGFDDEIISMYARGTSTREYPGAPGRDVRSGSKPGADLGSDRRCSRGAESVAEPGARS